MHRCVGVVAKSEMEGGARNPMMGLYFVFGAAALDSKVHTLSTADWFLDRIVLIRRQKFHSTWHFCLSETNQESFACFLVIAQ